LCQDGSPAPIVEEWEDIAELSCSNADWIVSRTEGRQCDASQATVGFYCGCENTIPDGVCRICGGKPLEDPTIVAYTDEDGDQVYCGVLEYRVNAAGTDCQDAQNEYLDMCCPALATTLQENTRTVTTNDGGGGLDKAAKLGIGLGIGIPAFIFLCAICIYCCMIPVEDENGGEAEKDVGSDEGTPPPTEYSSARVASAKGDVEVAL
jgi:hypothetical protein